MGSPLLGILAELFLNNFEYQHMCNNSRNIIINTINKIVFYFIYVNDTFSMFNANERQFSVLHYYYLKNALKH